MSNLIVKYTFDPEINTNLLPTFNSGFTNYTVNDEGAARCIYSDDLPTSISFNGATALTGVLACDTSNVTTMVDMFNGCSVLTSLDTSNFDTSNVTDMSNMFYNCSNLTSLDVSNFNTSKVTNMTSMFRNCKTLTSLDVSNFNTSKVTNMMYMFNGCSNLTSLDVSNFNTLKVTSMTSMFRNCKTLTSLDVSSFNTLNVTSMASMFQNCHALASLDLSNFNTSKVVSINSMFQDCNNLTFLDLSNFDTTNVTNIGYMFSTLTQLKHIGMIYVDIDSINKISAVLPYIEGLIRTVYVQDVSADQCTAVQGVEFRDYKGCKQTIKIPIQLVNEAELYWDDQIGRYCIKESSGSIIQTDISNLITLDTYNSYYKIVTDEKEVAPISITANVAIKFREGGMINVW